MIEAIAEALTGLSMPPDALIAALNSLADKIPDILWDIIGE